jgi:hypothetical protein
MDLFNVLVNIKEWLIEHIKSYDIAAKEYFLEGIKK